MSMTLKLAAKKKKKMVPIAKQDYTSRLKEMAQRLEFAKQNYCSDSDSPPREKRGR